MEQSMPFDVMGINLLYVSLIFLTKNELFDSRSLGSEEFFLWIFSPLQLPFQIRKFHSVIATLAFDFLWRKNEASQSTS